MLSSTFAVMLAAAKTAAKAATPLPKQVQLPANFQFNTVTFGQSHPALVAIVQTLFIVSAVGLIALMSVQTTKNEGLSGTIGGRSESAYRGRLGLDQQLTRLTGVVAVAFVFLAITYFLVTR